ncbi:MAG TPA: hypothetical protein VMQ93_08430 [Novosphingobium sp.]|nr:hypothetical protein [Novosphingobium sp.]
MAAGPDRRRAAVAIGSSIAIAVGAAVALGVLGGSRHDREPQVETSLGALPVEGRVVLRVLAPTLY